MDIVEDEKVSEFLLSIKDIQVVQLEMIKDAKIRWQTITHYYEYLVH